ncbi:MAG: hypothetical protein ACREJ2_16180 [Planctomycetota bacterium]
MTSRARGGKRQPAERSPKLVWVLVFDLIVALIWGATAVGAILQGGIFEEVIGAFFLVLSGAIVALGLLQLRRHPVVLGLGVVMHGLLTALFVVTAVLDLIVLFRKGHFGSYEYGQFTGMILFTLLPVACTVQQWKAMQFQRKAAKAAAPDEPEDIQVGPGWDEAGKP